MYPLDTDTISHLHAGHPRVLQRLQDHVNEFVATTIISRIELLEGRFEAIRKAASAEQLLRAQERLTRTEERLAEIPIMAFDARAAGQFERLINLKQVRRIGRPDLLIASIALANNATLVTRNLRGFRKVPQLKVVNWVD